MQQLLARKEHAAGRHAKSFASFATAPATSGVASRRPASKFPFFAMRFGTERIVSSFGSSLALTSLQASGVETVAPGTARTL